MTGPADVQQPLHRYAVLTAVATLVLLIAGGQVTSTDSGLAVPDWPLSYGMWFPPMVGGIFYEHSHRMIAALVGMMIAVLAVWLWRAEPRRWVRRLGYSALAAVILQGLLGGLTVLLLLPPQISIAHACLGQAVFCLVVCLARATSPGWTDGPRHADDRDAPSLRMPALSVAMLAGLQLVLGAVIRHTGAAVGPHVVGAVVLLLGAGWLVLRTTPLRRSTPTLRAHARRLLGLLCLQVLVGGMVLMHRGFAALRTAHVATGALILAQAVVLAWEVIRGTAVATSNVTASTVSAGASG